MYNLLFDIIGYIGVVFDVVYHITAGLLITHYLWILFKFIVLGD